MLAVEKKLDIATPFDSPFQQYNSQHYNDCIRGILHRFIPEGFFFFEESEREQCREFLLESLPMIRWDGFQGDPLSIAVIMLCPYRLGAGRFFLDMISKWLMPGKRLNISAYFAGDFKLPSIGNEVYICSELILTVENKKDIETIRRNLMIISNEIKLGLISIFHASRILEIKGLSSDEKTSLIQDRITLLVQKKPERFDFDMFSEMQHFLVMCKEEFKLAHEYQYMTRIIYVFYLFRKEMRKRLDKGGQKRYISFKLARARLHLPLGVKKVLGMFIAFNFLKENEVFEEKHIERAVKHFNPMINIVKDSFFMNEIREDHIRTMYLEIEKSDGLDFSLDEIKKLRRHFPNMIKNHVECLIPPVFMPRNEEEVMRNIVTLSQELRYIRDIPQVIITFDEQTDRDLTFTVILLHILKREESMQKLFPISKTGMKMTLDRVKQVGFIRKKYPKEALVLRVKLLNTLFLRRDHSVDLYKARQRVTEEIIELFGEVRDFNGGMIAQQNEAYLAVKNLLGEIGQKNEFLLENFFHSIFPVEMRSVLEPKPLRDLFLMLLDMIERKTHEGKKLDFVIEMEYVYAIVGVNDHGMKQKIYDVVEDLNLSSRELISVNLQVYDTLYLGYIFTGDAPENRQRFLHTLEGV